ncbi:MAG: hypothetical protein AAF368_03325 [Planctomycetota bacterium]
MADVAPPTSGAAVVMPRMCPPHNNLDPTTWPQDPEEIPAFVRAIQLPKFKKVKELADDYFRGSSERPALCEVDRMYGPSARGNTGRSWRSQQNRGKSRAFNQDFSSRLLVWRWLDKQGDVDAGVATLQQRIDKHFHPDHDGPLTVPGTWSEIRWLIEKLRSEQPGIEKRSAQAKRSHETRAQNAEARRRARLLAHSA